LESLAFFFHEDTSSTEDNPQNPCKKNKNAFQLLIIIALAGFMSACTNQENMGG